MNKFKPVYTGVELGINYITHLYSLAEAGFKDDDYIGEYGDSIPIEDKNYLKDHSHYMSFARRDHGAFAGRLYFVPAYFNMKNRQDYEDYFQAWSQAVKQKSFSPVEKYCCFNYDYRELFKTSDEIWSEFLEDEPLFQKIGEIYVNNIDYYCNNIWPGIELILSEKSQKINSKIKNGLIGEWEQITGYQFERDEYRIVLFYAGSNGPSFNNLSLDKNTAYYNHDEECMIDMISHEVGIHIVLPYLGEIIKKFERDIPRVNDSDVYGNISYMAFESLVSFYNMKFFDKELDANNSHNDFNTFFGIYSKLYYSSITPLDLYNEGVKEYIKIKIQ